jgi:ParB/RepB/Spo0J family partition protein
MTEATVTAVSHAKPALEFINLDLIDFLPQVRTASGLEEDELRELAESIKAQGLLQPVLLRPNGPSYALIAGERRCRAARLAGFSHVPALIGDVDDSRAATMQLVENVQRVDLSLVELAAALRNLADQGKTLSEICAIVKKSKPWVSKHLAASVENLGYYTRQFLDGETTEDLELVLVINQIEKTGKWYPRGTQLVDKIEEGKAGRNEARELLATLKEELAAEKSQKKADNKAAQQGSLQLDGEAKESEPPKWSASDELAELRDRIQEPHTSTAEEMLAHLNKAQLTEMAALYKHEWTNGKKLVNSTPVQQMRAMSHFIHDEIGYGEVAEWETAAFILGAASIKLTMNDLVAELQQLAKV